MTRLTNAMILAAGLTSGAAMACNTGNCAGGGDTNNIDVNVNTPTNVTVTTPVTLEAGNGDIKIDAQKRVVSSANAPTMVTSGGASNCKMATGGVSGAISTFGVSFSGGYTSGEVYNNDSVVCDGKQAGHEVIRAGMNSDDPVKSTLAVETAMEMSPDVEAAASRVTSSPFMALFKGEAAPAVITAPAAIVPAGTTPNAQLNGTPIGGQLPTPKVK